MKFSVSRGNLSKNHLAILKIKTPQVDKATTSQTSEGLQAIIEVKYSESTFEVDLNLMIILYFYY
jgi:hypothetical protein